MVNRDNYVGPVKAAKFIGRSEETLLNWVSRYALPFEFDEGGRHVYPMDALRDTLRERSEAICDIRPLAIPPTEALSHFGTSIEVAKANGMKTIHVRHGHQGRTAPLIKAAIYQQRVAIEREFGLAFMLNDQPESTILHLQPVEGRATIDIAHSHQTVRDAMSQLVEAIEHGLATGTRLLEVIHGYGSSGAGGAIKAEMFRRRPIFESLYEVTYDVHYQAWYNPGSTQVVLQPRLPVSYRPPIVAIHRKRPVRKPPELPNLPDLISPITSVDCSHDQLSLVYRGPTSSRFLCRCGATIDRGH